MLNASVARAASAQAPGHLTVGDQTRPLAMTGTALASLQQAGQGWMPSSQPFGGVIVKLSEGRGDATVNLRAGR